MDLKERATTKEIKCEPTQTTAAKLFPSESPATAKVSLLVVSRSYLLQLYCFTSSVIVGHQTDLAGRAYLVLTPAENPGSRCINLLFFKKLKPVTLCDTPTYISVCVQIKHETPP